ncbi:IS200/IS605 family transposase [candidate division CSSED10-310 bacterium]|uniref:IS200/IS605 family transposase n=1 Tax=candidate division CSSED10-310 bacterium TaxID=2855610 RepID=A0ABV6Z483_UNCC1
MADTFVCCYLHIIFSTKYREPYLSSSIQNRVWAYLGGIAKEHEIMPICIGGTADHTHLLLSLPSTITISKVVQLIKGGSSKWISDTFNELKQFAWQSGYGAFSIGLSMKERTMRYIEQQEKHHRQKTFQEEYLEFLKRYHIEFDERYVFD